MDFCRTDGLSVHDIWEAGRSLFLLGTLFYMSWTDVRNRKISNRLLLLLLCAGGASLVLESCIDREWIRVQEAAAGMILGGGLCFLCYLLSRGGIGAGDVKLFAVTGFYMGRTDVLWMAWVSVLLAAGSCILLLFLKKADRHMRLPYAPFVFLAVIAVFIRRTGTGF